MRHPNIVNLFYTFQDPGSLYYMMELLPHGEFLTKIRQYNGLQIDCARWYAAELTLAVEFMQSKGVIHRDLKPENLLLSADDHLKVVDFGTAKDLRGDRRVRAFSFVGTAEYIAPELLQEKGANMGFDIWALGCCIYQFISGRVPFRGRIQYHTFQLINNRSLFFPEYFPDTARDLVDKLLAMDEKCKIRNGA